MHLLHLYFSNFWQTRCTAIANLSHDSPDEKMRKAETILEILAAMSIVKCNFCNRLGHKLRFCPFKSGSYKAAASTGGADSYLPVHKRLLKIGYKVNANARLIRKTSHRLMLQVEK